VWLIPVADERVGVQVKLRSPEHVPYLSLVVTAAAAQTRADYNVHLL